VPPARGRWRALPLGWRHISLLGFTLPKQWRLTDRLGAATVAYLLVLLLALTAVLAVLFVARPVAIRWENVVRRRSSARRYRPTD
jgi:hypothetical protein